MTSRGGKKKSRFCVSSTAKAIIHGTMDEISHIPATLLVYEFEFLSYKTSARIKEAQIVFQFQVKAVNSTGAPKITAIRPKGRHALIETLQNEKDTLNLEANLGANIAGLELGGKIAPGREVEKTTTHATTVTGTAPADEYGDKYIARWSLVENSSQESGVPSFLRVAILIERESKDNFTCVPYIEAKLDLKSQLYTLLSTEAPDEPIFFEPDYEPYNKLGKDIDELNLATAGIDTLWDCTFYNRFGEPIKPSKVEANESPENGVSGIVTTEITEVVSTDTIAL